MITFIDEQNESNFEIETDKIKVFGISISGSNYANETENAIKLIGKDWALITAGDESGYNTMTASWGCMGVLWNKNVCVAFVRPQRYTYEFIENSNTLSLSFFDEKYRLSLYQIRKLSSFLQ